MLNSVSYLLTTCMLFAYKLVDFGKLVLVGSILLHHSQLQIAK